ncbi:MAG TPA: hypothetical protein VJZ27_10335, partial [Aggregatilineales bacterium]|nr:hypothetical protein [Aggregatilineales bacterium]
MSQDSFGQDEWVAQYEARVTARNTPLDRLMQYLASLPVWAHLAWLILVAISLPLITDNTYYIRVGGTVALTATLALGLHIVVGYSGMLDLGFVAFYGIGGYAYAYLSSDFTGVHLPTLVSIPLIVIISAFAGLLLGLPSLRLVG